MSKKITLENTFEHQIGRSDFLEVMGTYKGMIIFFPFVPLIEVNV